MLNWNYLGMKIKKKYFGPVILKELNIINFLKAPGLFELV